MSVVNYKPLKNQRIAFVIFGASGDLSLRMLIPSLETISCYDPFNDDTQLIGVARTEFKGNELKEKIIKAIKQYARLGQGSTDADAACEVPACFLRRLKYIAGDYSDPQTYAKLNETLDQGKFEGVLIYFATPPTLIRPITENLVKANLNTTDDRWVRIIIEKPFGWSFDSAVDLNKVLHNKFSEDDIYRIDHYLAKETVMNIFTFRWGNTIWEPLWNRNYISHVEILVAEAVDVGNRIGYYEGSSVLRDMIQNHLLQMLAIVAMEPPSEMNAKAIRDEKLKVLRSIRPLEKDDYMLGQYLGYKEHKGVEPDSTTPTFAYIRFFIDNWRWQGVPFYICSGKALQQKKSTIKLVFRDIPHALFGDSTINKPNVLEIKVQPEEGIILNQHVKVPGIGLKTDSIPLSFYYKQKFGENALQGAYERVILDAIHGDQSFFPRSDEIEECWKIVDRILRPRYDTIIPYAQKMDVSFGTIKRCKKNKGQRVTFKNASELVQTVTEQITRIISETIERKGACNIAFSGGQSPKPIYSLLTTAPFASRIDFSKVHIWFVDERCVPPDHEQSNYKMLNENMFKFLKIPEENIHRMRGEIDATKAAKEYEEELKKHFGTEDPVFDLITLGMGPEGHTASLFPGTPAVGDTKSLVIGHFVPHVKMFRVTLGRRVINNADNVMFIITDPARKNIIDLVFNAPYVPAVIPAQGIKPKHGHLTWNIVI
ncbi:glucose-6-phosphate 1-dehydrogenase family protein [Trichomonas vaginalis G3]|uniref:Glucose-6-phosphate 1-dehydrogenase n=1 Tax=Trichomonas vaginalis (strain ATCC PRA-98 / G3) TaxID=412133 RepID=A2DBT5_TRIV3|nr:glucose-6-phosphate 1-dehydrogenase (G6PD) family [Trichomonas vaginalis G3]EAY22288.1 glucose-6-phosphate 1-dehydrogenase family protein [Trichomonas vaginalis G3]KAI5533241.1 glucose-6-phosphate 1-dehydrogenase (G6PD) family [Trichomonas vaginalis G3]|eukprot:XP_001583274.1 glucose-6-phosphate 1-dehydrogenase family protein [Trichomonas vaginalis G3]